MESTNTDVLRPASFDEYIGQPKLKADLNIRVTAARNAKRPLDHMLLHGPPGAGKTSLARVIADMLWEPLTEVVMPITPDRLARIVCSFKGILFIDEIHDAPRATQEAMLPLLESGFMQKRNGTKIHTEWLTIIAATTDRGLLRPALYDRFPSKPEWEPYTDDELGLIVQGMGRKAGFELDTETATAYGRAAGGIPRNARSLVLAHRDFMDCGQDPSVEQVLDLVGLSKDGLSIAHRRYLEALKEFGGQAGLKPLSDFLRLHERVVVELERLLMAKGYVQVGDTRGRELIRDF